MKTSLLPLVLLLWCTLACDRGARTQEYEVLRTLPHDSLAYTQGLVYHDGFLFESTGRRGSSSVRKVRIETGEVLQLTAVPEEYFGEGLALAGSELFQLTWQSGRGFVYDLDFLTLQRTFEYEGEGWGLCHDGSFFFMSNGSDRILRRDPETFEVLEELRVTRNGISVRGLNELECVNGDIYANVYQTARIVRIDKATGRVVSELNGFRLSAAARRAPDPEAVLNGIAHDPVRGTFYVTGKLWSSLFEIGLDGL
ncbi:glutaminyl-peptide cyclotransferase [Gemmatimonadota bacterium]